MIKPGPIEQHIKELIPEKFCVYVKDSELEITEIVDIPPELYVGDVGGGCTDLAIGVGRVIVTPTEFIIIDVNRWQDTRLHRDNIPLADPDSFAKLEKCIEELFDSYERSAEIRREKWAARIEASRFVKQYELFFLTSRHV